MTLYPISGRYQMLVLMLMLLVNLPGLAADGSEDPSEHPEKDYYDMSLPREPEAVPLAPYQGNYYEAEVPDTLDLAEMAGNNINYLTRIISPKEFDYTVYQGTNLMVNPPLFEVGGHNALLWHNGKLAEAIV